MSTARRPLSPAEKEWLAESCEASGVPVKITDPVVLDQLAAILRGSGGGGRD